MQKSGNFRNNTWIQGKVKFIKIFSVVNNKNVEITYFSSISYFTFYMSIDKFKSAKRQGKVREDDKWKRVVTLLHERYKGNVLFFSETFMSNLVISAAFIYLFTHVLPWSIGFWSMSNFVWNWLTRTLLIYQ